MAFKGGQYAVTGTAVNIYTALSLTIPSAVRQVTIQYNPAAANDAYLGPSNVAATPANAAFKFIAPAANNTQNILVLGSAGAQQVVDLREIYLIGTAAATNIFFISIIY